ncbi:hypothetical protein ACNQR9_20575 [Mycolicibacterium peregrinum]
MPTTTTSTTVSPRRAGDPAPDLLGIALAHRAMLADLLRLGDLAAAVRDRDVICTPGRSGPSPGMSSCCAIASTITTPPRTRCCGR